MNITQLVEIVRARGPTSADGHMAFGRLVEQTRAAMQAEAARRLGCADDARDAVQESYIIAWQRIGQLRDAAAFEGWLRRIVVSQCHRRLRATRRAVALELEGNDMAAPPPPVEDHSVLAEAIAHLTEAQQRIILLFYFLGYSRPQIARLLHLKSATVGKRLHAARLRVRRALPPSVRIDIMREASGSFRRQVRRGRFDEFVGDYRFRQRPELTVQLRRGGDDLVAQAGGQQNRLTSLADDSLLTADFDGEARFERDSRGSIRQLVYYEFGERLGVATRVGA